MIIGNYTVASDIFIMKSTAVFSLLGRDGDHIRTDYGFTARIFVFHPSRRTSIYRKHADALRCGATRMTKSSLASTRPGS